MRRPLLLAAALAACAPKAPPSAPAPGLPVTAETPDAPPRERPPWETYADAAFTFHFPAGWMPFPPAGPARIIIRSPGVGALAADETGAPLQVGLAVETYDGPFDSPEAFSKLVRAGVEEDPAVEQLHRVESWDVRLCGDRTGRLHVFEFDKAGTGRRSQYQKLSVLDDHGNGWIALSWSVASRDSRLVAGDSPLTLRLRPWVQAFCLHPGEVDTAALKRGLEGADLSPD